jgi:hypothetical protein
MPDSVEYKELIALLNGIVIDADRYFDRIEDAIGDFLANEDTRDTFSRVFEEQLGTARDKYWSELPGDIRAEAKRLADRLVSLMGQVARSLKGALLVSEADQRDVMTATKAMRAALLLRQFRAWNPEVLHDEDLVLGVTPAGQSDDQPARPGMARRTFVDWADKVETILDLLAASPEGVEARSRESTEAARYRPGTAFIMMWMDKSQPELTDVSDAVKSVFEQFGINAVRADDIEHEGLITSRVLTEIRTAEFCFADLSGSRPNVYYEVGYAHALSRRVILFRKTGTGLHFDLAGYNCPEYKNLRDLREKLTHRLRALTNKEPKI